MIMQVPEVKFCGRRCRGKKETHLEKMKADVKIFDFNIILSEIFISEWDLSLRRPDPIRKDETEAKSFL